MNRKAWAVYEVTRRALLLGLAISTLGWLLADGNSAPEVHLVDSPLHEAASPLPAVPLAPTQKTTAT